ncbi:MAG: hypothetical protein J6N52_08095 [Clostridia bacterium]|nr:hypothetical protein [Clostridia bacterium]
MIKKIISVFFAFCMIWAMSVCAEAERISQTRKTEVLKELGLIDSYEENAGVTKKMFADTVDKIMGTAYSELYFDKSTEMNNIRLGEVLPVLIEMTGYTPKLNEIRSGNKEVRYVMLGKALGLLKNTNVTLSDSLTMKEYAEMLSAAIFDINILDKEIAGGTTTCKVSDETLLYRRLKIRYEDGILHSVGTSGTVPGTSKDTVTVGNTLYNTNISLDEEKYLGRYARVYIDDDENVVAVAICEDKNEEVYLTSEDVEEGADPDNRTIRYYDKKNRLRTAALSAEVDVVFNGERIAAYTADDFMDTDANIVLINNDNKTGYDVVIIESYTTVRVFDFSEDSGIICGTDGNNHDIEEFLEEGYRFINKDGTDMTFRALNKNDILSMRYTKSGKLTKIIAGNERINAVYEGHDDSFRYITADSKKYLTTKQFREDQGKTEKLTIGDMITIYFTFDGKAADYIVYSGGEIFGYMIRAYVDENDDAVMKVLLETGEIENLSFENQIRIDGAGCHQSGILKNTALAKDGKSQEQLVKLRLNSKNKIVSVRTAKNESNFGGYGFSGLTLNYDSADFEPLRPISRPEGMLLGSKYYANEDTKVFYVYDEDSISTVVKGTQIVGGAAVNMKIYNVDENYVPEAVVIRSGARAKWIDYYNTSYLVEDTKECADDDGDVYLAIVLRNGNTVTTAKIYDKECTPHPANASGNTEWSNIPIKDVPKGAIIQIKSDALGIYSYAIQFIPTPLKDERVFEGGDVSGGYDKGISRTILNGSLHCYGMVLGRTNSGLIMNFHHPDPEVDGEGAVFPVETWNRHMIFDKDNTVVTFYDRDRQKAETGTVDEINIGDMVYIQVDGSTMNNIVVYR